MCGFEPLPVDEKGEPKKQPNRRTRVLENRMQKLAGFGMYGKVKSTLLATLTSEQADFLQARDGCARHHQPRIVSDQGLQRSLQEGKAAGTTRLEVLHLRCFRFVQETTVIVCLQSVQFLVAQPFRHRSIHWYTRHVAFASLLWR